MNSKPAFLTRSTPGLSLRTKLLILLLIVTLLPISVLIVMNNIFTRQALTEAANTSLSSVAAQSGDKIDAFIFGTIETLEKESNLNVFKSALAQAEEGSQVLDERVLRTMQVLIDRNPDYLKTYALLNRKGEYRTGHPLLSGRLPPFLGLNPMLVNGLQISLVANLPYVSPVVLDQETGEARLYFAVRVNSNEGDILGLLLAVYDADILQNIIQESNNLAGESSYGILLDEHQIQLAHGTNPELRYKTAAPLSPNLIKTLKGSKRLFDDPIEELTINNPEFSEGLDSSRTEPFFSVNAGPGFGSRSQVAVQRLKSRPWMVAFVQSKSIFLQPVTQQTRINLILGVVFVLLSTIAAVSASWLIGRPIINLSEKVEQIAEGDLSITVPVGTQDEIGILASTFNSMTSQLKNLLEGLEQQVTERTQDLERRVNQLQTAAEVARDASEIQDLKVLLNQAVELISQRMDFYHVGIFLLGEDKSFAHLMAANSSGGKEMIVQGHKLRVGEVGIVGNTALTGDPHIALDVDIDPAHFAHELLPETRSEMALPLKIGETVIGALDVQSKKTNAFDEDDIIVIQVLADLLAIAIRNSQLLEEVNQSLKELQTAYGEFTDKGWKAWAADSYQSGYRYKGIQVESLTDPSPEAIQVWESGKEQIRHSNSRSSLTIPLQLRGETIGVINLKLSTQSIPDDLLNLTKDISERLAIALDNARLIEATQQKASQEALVSEITTRMRETLDIETIIKTASEEIRNALDLPEVTIRIGQSELRKEPRS